MLRFASPTTIVRLTEVAGCRPDVRSVVVTIKDSTGAVVVDGDNDAQGGRRL